MQLTPYNVFTKAMSEIYPYSMAKNDIDVSRKFFENARSNKIYFDVNINYYMINIGKKLSYMDEVHTYIANCISRKVFPSGKTVSKTEFKHKIESEVHSKNNDLKYINQAKAILNNNFKKEPINFTRLTEIDFHKVFITTNMCHLQYEFYINLALGFYKENVSNYDDCYNVILTHRSDVIIDDLFKISLNMVREYLA